MTAPRQGIEPALALALADQLVALTTPLAQLVADLAGDSETLRRHITALQAVDRIIQTHVALAEVLRRDGSVEDRVAAVSLDALHAALVAGIARYRSAR